MAGSDVLSAPAVAAGVTPILVRPLAETGHATTVAGWLHAAWWADEDWSLAGTEAWLRAAAGPAIPIVFVAEIGGEPVGTATLDNEDLAARPDLSPWLASVWVRPDRRGQGVARRLVARVEAQARAMGHRELWLFTPDVPGVYRRLGWADAGREEWRGRPVTLMRRVL